MDDYADLMKQAKELSDLFGSGGQAQEESRESAQGGQEASQGNTNQMLRMMELISMVQNMNKPPRQHEAKKAEAFEDAMTPPEIKVLKSALPYMQGPQARTMAVAVKAMELLHVMNGYGKDVAAMGSEPQKFSQREMLLAVSEHMDQRTRQMIELMIKIMDITEIMANMERMNMGGEQF